MEAMMVDYHALSRKELQALCKQHKIPANKTNLFMADSLAALLGKCNASEPEVVDAPPSVAKEETIEGVTERAIVSRAEESVGEAPSESPADDAIEVVKKASKGRAAKKTLGVQSIPVGPEDMCSAVKPATKRGAVRGKFSSLAKLASVETFEGSDEAVDEAAAEAKPLEMNAAATVRTAKLSDLMEESGLTQQEDMAAEFVAESEVPVAPEVVGVKKAVRGKRTGKKGQVDVIEHPAVESAPVVVEEVLVTEEPQESAPVSEVPETKKVRGKRVGKKAQEVDEQVDEAEFLQTEPVETAPILNQTCVEEEPRVNEPVEIEAVETKKVRGKRVGKKVQEIVEAAPIMETKVIVAAIERPLEDRALECVANHEESIPVAEVKKLVKGKRGGRKVKAVAQKVELPELMDTEAVEEEAEQTVEEVQENKTVKAIVSQFEQLTVGVVAEDIDGTPVVETDTKVQESAPALQVEEDMDHVGNLTTEVVPEMEQSAEEDVEVPRAAAKKAGRGKKAGKGKAGKGKALKAKDGAVAQASPPAIEIYCDIVVDEVVEEAANPIPDAEEPSSPLHGEAGCLSLASPVKSPSLAHHIENDSGMESDECDEAPTPLVHNMQRGSRKDQNMMMEVVDKENAVKSNIGDYPQSLRKLRKQLKEAIIKKKGSTPLASPLQDISLNVQSPRVEQSPSFSFQF